MGETRKIKPLVSICPKCGTENVTTEINVEVVPKPEYYRNKKKYGEGDNWEFYQSHIDCKNCGYGYVYGSS